MKRCCIIMILFLAALQLSAQEEKNDANEQGASLIDKLSLGGNFSLQFGNVTFIDISPMVGYRFTNRFTAGPGITYRYLKFRGFEGSSVYGGSLFARHIIGSQFFAHAQYESLNAEYITSLQDPVQRGWVPGFFLGGGIFQPLGRRGVVNISALYNLMYDPVRSPYNSPWVFNVGFML